MIPVPPAQVPAWHVSPLEQELPSSHPVSSGLMGLEQPVAGEQVPAAWHWSSAVQPMLVPAQTPALHVSPVVQTLLSSHVLVFGACVQAPAPSHISVVHTLLSVHAALQQTWFGAQNPVAPFAKTQSLLTLQPLAPGPPA